MSIDRLNEPQQQAVRYLDGPCLVIAGAGSGKTRVITQKIVHLANAGIEPARIAAITFTNKAANEMAERLKKIMAATQGSSADGSDQSSARGRTGSKRGAPLVCTFHSLGVRMLRQDAERLGLKKNFSILDADDATGILQQALGTTDRRVARTASQQISLWKNALIEPDDAAAQAPDNDTHAIARAYRDYMATLKAYQAVDFDDLIRLPVALLQQDEQAAAGWRERLRYLLVDEYQDTNACQYELLKLLVGPRAAFTAVGDDDQSIYGWRGATLANLERLGEDYPKLRVIKLEQNYRSSQRILSAANALISSNPKLHEKRLFSELGTGDEIRVIPCDSEEEEAEAIVMKLQAMKFEKRSDYADFAILYRGNFQARVFEKALRNERIPYQISGGQSFFDRAEIRDLMAYLRLLANDDDDPAFIRAVTCPKRGVGNTTLASLGAYAGRRGVSMFEAMFEAGFDSEVASRQLTELRTFGEFINRLNWRSDHEPAAELLDELLSAIDYRGHLFATHEEKVALVRWQNVTDFITWVKKRAEDDGATLKQMAQTLAILTQLDREEDGRGAVRLSTIHAAKGLEYPHVFIVGCEEGMLPHHGGKAVVVDGETVDESDGEDPGDSARIEEERRLMYVAVTRAQRSLHLSWCKVRKKGRTLIHPRPSRFIAEMQLDARPSSQTTITGAAARGRLGALKGLLTGNGRNSDTAEVEADSDKAAGPV
ncbi:MAG: UvrD-helicase domain-containing protein [Burkholderiaceae bacterium]